MKKIMFLAMMMTIAISANAMTYNTARNEALFLSDKMAYELGLSNAQYEAIYKINLDYLLNMNSRVDVNGPWWDIRNRDLRHVLSPRQYDRYMTINYFFRPVVFRAGSWTLAIYNRYNRSRMFMHRPAVYTEYRGGHHPSRHHGTPPRPHTPHRHR